MTENTLGVYTRIKAINAEVGRLAHKDETAAILDKIIRANGAENPRAVVHGISGFLNSSLVLDRILMIRVHNTYVAACGGSVSSIAEDMASL